jgi:hypothetical protein
MRNLFCFVLIFISTSSLAQEKSDTIKHRLKFSGFFSINSNGIAAVPAFSLGKPAYIAALSLKKNRFSYEPQLSYTIDFKPWVIDNWFHYKIIGQPKFELKGDFDLSMFFSELQTSQEVVWRGQRYATFGFTGTYKIIRNTSMSLIAWYDRGLDPGTLIGYYLNLVADRSSIPIGKSIILGANLQVFYVDYTGNNDGLFISPKISSSLKHLPLSLYFQVIQAITSNVTPFPGFRWNVGLSYSF